MRLPTGGVLIAVFAAGTAHAHPLGGPAVAWPTTPHSVGLVVDERYRFEWTDTNFITSTGTITIDWFYTPVMPPTFPLGSTPEDLVGTPIVLGIDEEDRTDAYTWDTSTVAPGSYWLWSRMNDLPGETSLRINAFSRGVVTVAHRGDVVHPAIAMTSPRSPFESAQADTYLVTYEAFDPDGTGRVALEAMRQRDASDAVEIASDLPAASSATVTWSVADLPDGEWILRATLRDGRGLTAVAYGRFVLASYAAWRVDAGPLADSTSRPPADGGREDIGTYDAGDRLAATASGCGCAHAPPSEAALYSTLFVALCWLGRRPRSSFGATPTTRSTP